MDLAGTTVLRAGLRPFERAAQPKILRLSQDLPLIIESWTVREDRAFVAAIRPIMGNSLIIRQAVQ
jgi:PII-like signaling protein